MSKPTDLSTPAPRDRIMKAAERLFATKGLHGAGVREIAREANVNGNLISYHFKSKEELYISVMVERSRHITSMREELLEKLCQRYSPGVPPVNEIMHALVHPIFVLREQDPEIWSNFLRAYLREVGTHTWKELNALNISPAMKRFTAILHRSLPSAKRADIIFILEMVIHCQAIAADALETAFVGDDLAMELRPRDLESQLIRALTAAAVQFS
jgi:AcrR family transcriptional regulator